MTAQGAWVMLQLFAGVFGLLFGSFMNVCIARMPEDRSVVHPGSACPKCAAPIKPYDNVPVLAWMWLRGRCRACRAPISPLYPLVEATFGVLMVLLFRHVVGDIVYFDAPHVVAVVWYGWLLFAVLAMTFTDLQHKIIPDEFSIYSVPVGVGGAALLGWLGYEGSPTWQQSVIGALVGGGLLASVIGLYWVVRREEGMGWGDAKLLAMFGAWFGAFPGVAGILMIGSVTGSLVGVGAVLILRRGLKLAIPFGPFLGLGALVWCFFGRAIALRWGAHLL
ncbi:MAG: prepilin peptidase [Myxococcales bacterium]|nr:prepilin peptidase [Myxococcales bacterium]